MQITTVLQHFFNNSICLKTSKQYFVHFLLLRSSNFMFLIKIIALQGNSRKGFVRCRLSCLLHNIHYLSAHKQLRRHLLNPFREFPCMRWWHFILFGCIYFSLKGMDISPSFSQGLTLHSSMGSLQWRPAKPGGHLHVYAFIPSMQTPSFAQEFLKNIKVYNNIFSLYIAIS